MGYTMLGLMIKKIRDTCKLEGGEREREGARDREIERER